MRTTVDIPDALYRRLKSQAAVEGRSVRALLTQAAELALAGEKPRRRRRVTLPLISSATPGTLEIDNAKIYALVPFP